MADVRLLCEHLRDAERLACADGETWNALIRIARAELLIGQLGTVASEAGVRGSLPDRVRAILDDVDITTAASQRSARWEAGRAAAALRPLDCPVILLKGAAYVCAGLPAAAGRSVGDLDILVPRDRLDEAERALARAGWVGAKQSDYDQAYYRRWMHELPPMLHLERGSIVDVHHTILPLTARLRPDAAALIEARVEIGSGLSVLCPEDMVLHAATHSFYDADFAGALRGLWDIHRLVERFDSAGFRMRLGERARLHQLSAPLGRALRFARELFGTPVDPMLTGRFDALDALIRRRLLARDIYGRSTRGLTRRALYIRGHWLRMPPLMLARHLFTKWRQRKVG